MDAVVGFINRILESLGITTAMPVVTGPSPQAIRRKASLIIYNPMVNQNQSLRDAMQWNDPDALVQGYINDIEQNSFNYAHYDIVERINADKFPVLEDGYSYKPDEFLNNMQTMSGFHKPEMVDYYRILDEFDIINKVNSGKVDEVWLMGFPFAGFFESRMVGRDAFWCNGPAITNINNCQKRFVVMGFNYERGVGEMLEAFGHRTESIMEYVFRKRGGENNLWHRYIRYEKTAPGKAEIGNVHYAPNSTIDYDWGNTTRVMSRCDTWYKFPDLTGEPRMVDCSEWGDGDIRQHHQWWLKHLPHIGGSVGSISNNWWQYIIDPNLVK